MTCRLFGTKSLCKPVPTHRLLDPWELILFIFLIKLQQFENIVCKMGTTLFHHQGVNDNLTGLVCSSVNWFTVRYCLCFANEYRHVYLLNVVEYHVRFHTMLHMRLLPIQLCETSQKAYFMGPTWGPLGSCRPQMDHMLAPWTLLSGM